MKGLRSPRGRGFRKILRCHFGEWLKWDEERFEDESHSESNSGSRGDRRNVSDRLGRVWRKQRGRRQGQGLLPELQAGDRRPVGRARQEIHRQDRRAGEGADGRLGHLSADAQVRARQERCADDLPGQRPGGLPELEGLHRRPQGHRHLQRAQQQGQRAEGRRQGRGRSVRRGVLRHHLQQGPAQEVYRAAGRQDQGRQGDQLLRQAQGSL